MRGPTLALVFLTVVLLLAVPASGLAPRDASASAAPTPSVSGFMTDATPIPSGEATRPLASSAEVDITLTLAPQDPAALNVLLNELSDPSAPEYRHYLTESEFEQRIAPTARTLQSVESILAQSGGRGIQATPDRMGVTATMAVQSIDTAFHTTLVQYRTPTGRSVYTTMMPPVLPSSLEGQVVGAGGFSDLSNVASAVAATLVSQREGRVASAPSSFVVDPPTGDQWFLGSDFTQAYGVSSLFPSNSSSPNASFGAGEAIATLLASAYNVTIGANLPPWDPTVLQEYFNDTLPSWWPVPQYTGVPVPIAGYSTAPAPGYFGNWSDDTSDELENSLDLEMAGSLAPGASLYNFYIPGSVFVGNPTYSDLADDLAQGLASALSYNYEADQLAVVSGSFGLPDLNDSMWDAELMHAAAIGATVVASSGDAGNAPNSLTGGEDGQWPVWPASAGFSSFGSVAVGGTEIELLGSPAGTWNGTDLNASFDARAGTILSQATWYQTSFAGVAGSEGGISTVYPEPSWQMHSAAQPAIVNATILQGAGSLGRSEPDVAFVANSTIAYVERNASGTFFTLLGGTSVAAPVFAGILAVLAGSSHHLFGYIDPELYRIASFYAQNPGPDDPFEDVTQGSNYVFSAGPGWDATTGWGSIAPSAFLAADANPAIQNYTYTGPVPLLPPSSSPTSPIPISLLFVIIGVALAVAVVLIIVFGRTKQPTGPIIPPPGSYGWPSTSYGVLLPPPTPPPLAGATVGTSGMLACPYCGGPRPSEPVRCPYCGQL
ncbi:MAG: protease pro-enzyme activation domain-containing protein [Thermoplasmata archaeon]